MLFSSVVLIIHSQIRIDEGQLARFCKRTFKQENYSEIVLHFTEYRYEKKSFFPEIC